MNDLINRRLKILDDRFVGKRVSDPRNGQTGTVIGARLCYGQGRLWWASGLHLIVKMDVSGTWIARFYDVKFCE